MSGVVRFVSVLFHFVVPTPTVPWAVGTLIEHGFPRLDLKLKVSHHCNELPSCNQNYEIEVVGKATRGSSTLGKGGLNPPNQSFWSHKKAPPCGNGLGGRGLFAK
jgi:hypothetical protein